MRHTIAPIIMALAITSCAALPILGGVASAIVQGVDVAKVLACRGAPDARAAALCVGAKTVPPTLHTLVDTLADRLERLEQDASGGGAEGMDLSPRQRGKMEREAAALVDELRGLGASI